MKYFVNAGLVGLLPVTLLAIALCGAPLRTTAQVTETRTTEQRTTTDENGKTTTTTARIESKIEDITPPKTHAVLIAPFRLLLFWNASYVHALNETVAIGGGIDIPASWLVSGLSGFGGHVEARFFPARRAIQGFYLAPTVGYTSVAYTTPEFSSGVNGGSTNRATVTAGLFAAGAVAGWMWFPWPEFTLDFGIGAAFNSINVTANTTNPYSTQYTGVADVTGLPRTSGFIPSLRVNIGYAW